MTRAGSVLTESVSIPVDGGGPMGGYVARPHITGPPAPAVLVGMELFGVSAHVRDVCERLAGLGYFALAPDLYHRISPATELAADHDGRAAGLALLQRLTRRQVLDDVRASIDFLHGHARQIAGMVGLSLGGHVAYLAATRFGLPATAVLYGGWLPTMEVPISRPEPTLAATHAITGRMLILVGENDTIVPSAHRREIAGALSAGRVDHELIEYPGAGHGFLCDRRATYHGAAAEDAWQRIARLLSSSPQHGRTPGRSTPGPG